MAPTAKRRQQPGSFPDPFVQFYDELLAVVATVSEDRLFRAIADPLLRHAIKYLVNDEGGIQVLVLACVPPALQTDPITSLYVSLAEGTPPWGASHRVVLQFHGAESLAGYAVQKKHPVTSQDMQANPEHLPLRLDAHAKSTAAFPLLRSGRVAGCLQVLSTEPDYFSLERLDMLRRYANILSLAFQSRDFHDHRSIALHLMPPYETQHPLLLSFRRRVQASLRQQQSLSLLQAEWQVLRDIERELRGSE